MPTYQVLTDRSLASSTAITPTTLIHIVTTGDTSQGNPAGSSYKAELRQLNSIFSGSTFTGGSSNCISDLYVSNIHGCSPISIFDSVRSSGSTVSGELAFAFGFATSATTSGATSFGVSNLSSGIGSFTQGYGNVASELASHAEGVLTQAIYVADHAEGYNTIANSYYYNPANPYGCHAEGWGCVAYGNASHAEGGQTQALGVASHSEGYDTVANGDFQHVQGLFNITGITTPGAFIIGNGSGPLNRSNLLVAANSGVTIYGRLSATTISATTYLNLPTTSSGSFLPLSGGTVTGQTFFTSGLTITGDTIIIDSTGLSTAIDTSTRELVDSSSSVSVDWENRSLYDDLGTEALVWTSTKRKLLDVTSADAVNWNDRLLTKSDGATVSFDWENGILTGQTDIKSTTISATTYQNLPIGYYDTTGITTSQTLTWDKSYWGISGSSNVDLTLPSTTSKDGYYLLIKDEAGTSGLYRIRVTPTSGLIDGNTYIDMNINYMSLTFVARNNNWWII